MHWWLEHLSFGFAAESVFKEDRIVRVRYEDLIEKPKETLTWLCSMLKIDYVPKMLSASGFKVPAYTMKQHALVGGSPEIKRLNAWEKSLLPRQVQIFESVACDILTYLGYEPVYAPYASGISDKEKFLTLISELFHHIANRFCLRKRLKQTLGKDDSNTVHRK